MTATLSRSRLRAVLTIALPAALLLAACTTQPAPRTAAAQSARIAPQEANCPKHTGSHLPPTREDCAQAGRTYSQQEMRDTGATNAADALRHLDPSVTGP